MQEEELTEKADLFSEIQLWPPRNVLNHKDWLSNFDNSDDRYIASIMLNFFMYFPKNLIIKMLATSIGRSGRYISSFYSKKWEKQNFLKNCWYSMIQGEDPNPTDSGHIFLRTVRDSLNVTEDKIINNSLLCKKMVDCKNQVIIFVDDFVGSGSQCATTLTRINNGRSLYEIAEQNNHIIIYTPLIINESGLKGLKEDFPNLIISPTHILGKEYNLLKKECICWKNSVELYEKGQELIYRKGKELGMPFSDGGDVWDVEGFRSQGLAIAFEHGIPDATIPLFRWKNFPWKPLISY